MATRQVKHPATGETVEVELVDILGEKNIPIIIKLADGAILQFKVHIIEAARTPREIEESDEQGYMVNSSTSLTLLEPRPQKNHSS